MDATGFIPASSSKEFVDSITEIHDQLMTARYMAIGGCTLLVYDWVTTMDKEIEFIWGRKWSFARTVYHLNRVLPLLLFSVILIPNILFAPSYYTATMLVLNHPIKVTGSNIVYRCKQIILSYSYGVVGLLVVLCVTSIIRCWALYGQRWILWILIPALFLTVGHALAQVTLHIRQSLYLGNPLPGVLEGCLVILPSGIWLAYLSGVLYESLVFGLLVWRIWRLSSGFGLTPLVKQLLKHGASFYAVNFGLMLISCVGSGYSRTIIVVNVSGVLTALSSIMCSRIFFSMYEFANPERGQISVGHITTGPSEVSGSGHFGFAMETFREGNPPIGPRIGSAIPASKNPNPNLLVEKPRRSKPNDSYV